MSFCRHLQLAEPRSPGRRAGAETKGQAKEITSQDKFSDQGSRFNGGLQIYRQWWGGWGGGTLPTKTGNSAQQVLAQQVASASKETADP